MPPDGYIYEVMAHRWPDLLIELGWGPYLPDEIAVKALTAALAHHEFDVRIDRHNVAHTLDAISRAVREGQAPTPSPFLPITHRRAMTKEHASFLEDQEQRNLPYITRYAPELTAHKSHERRLPAVVLQDRRIDLSVPSGLVVFHQVGIPRKIVSSRDQRLVRVVERHLELTEGDVVRYRHTRSATLRTRWQPLLGYGPPHSLNKPSVENALRVELSPKQGLYLGEKLSNAIAALPIEEREVVLPPNTVWRVIGIRDVIQPDHRERSMPPDPRIRTDDGDDRLRAILMVEIDEDEIPPGDLVIDMTEPF